MGGMSWNYSQLIEFDWKTIIPAGITAVMGFAGVVTGHLVAWLFTRNTKKLDYQNDFYKEVVKKRFEALSAFETALTPMMRISKDQESGMLVHCFMFEGVAPYQFDEVWGTLRETAKVNSPWLSGETIKALKDLFAYLEQINHLYNLFYTQYNREHCFEAAKAVYNPLQQRIQAVRDALRKDYRRLPDVAKFLEELDSPVENFEGYNAAQNTADISQQNGNAGNQA